MFTSFRNALVMGFAAAMAFFLAAWWCGLSSTSGQILGWCAVGAQALPLVYVGLERFSHPR